MNFFAAKYTPQVLRPNNAKAYPAAIWFSSKVQPLESFLDQKFFSVPPDFALADLYLRLYYAIQSGLTLSVAMKASHYLLPNAEAYTMTCFAWKMLVRSPLLLDPQMLTKNPASPLSLSARSWERREIVWMHSSVVWQVCVARTPAWMRKIASELVGPPKMSRILEYVALSDPGLTPWIQLLGY
jgi:hypothetical protein